MPVVSILDVADAVVNEANTEFAGEFIAERIYFPEFDLPDFVTAQKAIVIPKDSTTTLLSGDHSQSDIEIDFALQR